MSYGINIYPANFNSVLRLLVLNDQNQGYALAGDFQDGISFEPVEGIAGVENLSAIPIIGLNAMVVEVLDNILKEPEVFLKEETKKELGELLRESFDWFFPEKPKKAHSDPKGSVQGL